MLKTTPDTTNGSNCLFALHILPTVTLIAILSASTVLIRIWSRLCMTVPLPVPHAGRLSRWTGGFAYTR